MPDPHQDIALKRHRSRMAAILKRSCRTADLKVARECAAAAESLTKENFELFCNEFGFGYPNGRKLVRVGTSERIKSIEGKICYFGWSTLYELDKLTDHQFESFSAVYLSGDKPKPFTKSNVRTFRAQNTRPNFVPVICVDIEAAQIDNPELLSVACSEAANLERRLDSYPGLYVRMTRTLTRFEAQPHPALRNKHPQASKRRLAASPH